MECASREVGDRGDLRQTIGGTKPTKSPTEMVMLPLNQRPHGRNRPLLQICGPAGSLPSRAAFAGGAEPYTNGRAFASPGTSKIDGSIPKPSGSSPSSRSGRSRPTSTSTNLRISGSQKSVKRTEAILRLEKCGKLGTFRLTTLHRRSRSSCASCDAMLDPGALRHGSNPGAHSMEGLPPEWDQR